MLIGLLQPQMSPDVTKCPREVESLQNTTSLGDEDEQKMKDSDVRRI